MPTAREHRFAISEAVATLNKALKAAHDDNINVKLVGAGTEYITFEYVDGNNHVIREPGQITLYDVAERVEEIPQP